MTDTNKSATPVYVVMQVRYGATPREYFEFASASRQAAEEFIRDFDASNPLLQLWEWVDGGGRLIQGEPTKWPPLKEMYRVKDLKPLDPETVPAILRNLVPK